MLVGAVAHAVTGRCMRRRGRARLIGVMRSRFRSDSAHTVVQWCVFGALVCLLGVGPTVLCMRYANSRSNYAAQ
jgi:hypothetical protein